MNIYEYSNTKTNGEINMEANYRSGKSETSEKFRLKALTHLKGRTIVDVKRVTELDGLGVEFEGTLKIIFDNGHWMTPSADSEGNDGGVLFTTFEEAGTLL